MKKMFGYFCIAIMLLVFDFYSTAYPQALKIVKEYKTTITGTLQYARMQYFLHTPKGEAYCIYYDENTQEDALQNMVGKTVKMTGNVKVFKDGGKCIDVSPEKPKPQATTASADMPNTLTTVAGKLEIRKQKDETPIVQLNGKTIYVGQGGFSLNFQKLFEFGSYQAVLVSDATGGTACPEQYVFITLKSGGSSSVTKSFGNCSDLPKIQQAWKKVTLKFPPFGAASTETWTYQEGKIVKTK